MAENKQFPLAVFNPSRLQLAEYKKVNAEITFDYADPKGNEAARSHIYALRRAKAAVEKARKEEKEESLEYGRKVDKEAKAITAEIEDMIDVHQKPLDEIEEKEKQRIADIREKVESLKLQRALGKTQSSVELKSILESYKNKVIDETFGEYREPAELIRKVSIEELEVAITEAEMWEAQQAELQRLREAAAAKEKEEAERQRQHEEALEVERQKTREVEEAARIEREARDKADREEKIRREAEEKAKREAEEAAARKIQEEREAKEKAERETAEAEERRIKEAKEAAEKLQAAEKKAEEDRIAAAKKAEDEKIAAAKLAEEERAAAVQKERDEAEALKKKEADELALREADKAHRAKINNEALQALLKSGITEDFGKAIISSIARGEIPHVKINY